MVLDAASHVESNAKDQRTMVLSAHSILERVELEAKWRILSSPAAFSRQRFHHVHEVWPPFPRE
jgi:hypothetical protein